MWIPPGNPEIWNTLFKLREKDVLYELRFQPCDYAKTLDKRIVRICGIPANSGSADYTMNQIEEWGDWSASYTVNDPALEPCTQEEAEWSVRNARRSIRELMKQAFIATIEIQMVVWAEDEIEAQSLALSNANDQIQLGGNDFQIQRMDRCFAYPNGWNDDDLLYTNGDDEVTLKEAWNKKGVSI